MGLIEKDVIGLGAIPFRPAVSAAAGMIARHWFDSPGNSHGSLRSSIRQLDGFAKVLIRD
jgi:hypothetical protein